MNPFLQNIKQFLSRLSPGQKAALAAVLLGGVALLSGVAYWAGQPDYAILFGSLDPTAANKVVESLQADGIKYDLRENGTAIFVPREDVYELRLRFAGEGIVSEGPVGYELFDKGTLGMTDFMQKLNLKRALEGELARTISSVRQVELCRVHLVIPERSPFRETQTQPSASVVLQLNGGSRLSTEQIEGITALVAGAVEGMAQQDVTILDTRGNLLSNPDAKNQDIMTSANQLRMQTAVETHLTGQGQSMLDRVLGAGNAIVRVSATLDFNRTVAERELIDPESATVISEERLEEEGGPDAGNANSSVRNYELSRTRERSEKNAGEISYLTVSVILNYKKTPPPADQPEALPEIAPYPDAEIAEIESLVQNAVGFNPERGDRFAIHQTRFDTSVDDQLAAEIRDQRKSEEFQLYLRYGLMAVALALAVWLIRSAGRRVTAAAQQGTGMALTGGQRRQELGGDGMSSALSGPGGINQLVGGDEEELVLLDDVYTSKLSPDAKKRLKAKHLMYEEIKKQVLERPADTADLIRSWMASDAKA